MRRDSLLYAGGFRNRWLLLSAAAGRRPPARIYYGATGSTDRSHPYTGRPSESIVLPDDPATLSTAFFLCQQAYVPNRMQYSAGLTRVNANVLCRLRQRPISGRDDRILRTRRRTPGKRCVSGCLFIFRFSLSAVHRGAKSHLATEKDQHIADAKRFILEGVMENTPMWRKKASDAPPQPTTALP